jgi:phage tail-like protein
MTSEPILAPGQNGHNPLFPPGLLGEATAPVRSRYLEFLPGVYHRNEFLGRFLLIFEELLAPLDRQIANLPHYFDPDTTTEELLDWLGEWVAIVFDDRVPVERRRSAVNNAVRIYRRRGTSRGLAEFIEAVTGERPEIVEPTLADVSRNAGLAFTFTVRMTVPADSPIEEDLVQRVIDVQKPAFAAATLEFGRARA